MLKFLGHDCYAIDEHCSEEHISLPKCININTDLINFYSAPALSLLYSPDSRISVLPLRNYFRRVVHAFDYFPHTGTGCITCAMRVHPLTPYLIPTSQNMRHFNVVVLGGMLFIHL